MATTDFSLKSLVSKLVWPAAFGVLLYVAVSVWLVSGKQELGAFQWGWLPVLLLLSLANYLLRFGKWQYYLRILKSPVPWKDSFVIFMSGLALSITPSKLGEVMRSYFVKEGFGVPVSRTAPIVLADRLSDMMALIILSAVGAYSYGYGQSVVWVVAAGVAAIFIVVTVRPLGNAALRLLGRAPGINERRLRRIEQLYDSSATLLDFRRILLPLALSVVAWGCEGLGFYLTLKGFGLQQGVMAAMFIYAFSTIVGAVTMLPGGLGTTEGTLAGLMKVVGVATGTAALAAIIIRAATLWFGVAIGAVYLIMAERRYRGPAAERMSYNGSRHRQA